jgi:hypothetical protein
MLMQACQHLYRFRSSGKGSRNKETALKEIYIIRSKVFVTCYRDLSYLQKHQVWCTHYLDIFQYGTRDEV